MASQRTYTEFAGLRPKTAAVYIESSKVAKGTTTGAAPLSETPQEYIERILGNVGEQDCLKVQAATPKRLERLIRGQAGSKLRRQPTPGKWSVAEILAHLADSEIVLGWRIRQILGAPGTPMQAYDQDSWAAAGHYAKRAAGKSLEQFRAVREANLALFKSLTPEQWKHYGLHAERGKETIEHIARLTAGHDINHTRQVERILGVRTR